MNIKRRKTRGVMVGKVKIGDLAPISVQSMTKSDTRDVSRVLREIKRLERAGCEIVRLAIPDKEASRAFKEIKKRTHLPLVADIHFNYRLGMECIKSGADKIRINPGTIGAKWKLREIIKGCKDYNIPIRVGLNTGSLEKGILRHYKAPSAEALLESLRRTLDIFDRERFYDIVISAKASDVATTIKAYELISEEFPDYPLHIGLTESGPLLEGSIRSSIAMGLLLSKGIGDTIRISLTSPSDLEVRVAYEILRSLGLREYGPTLISCPICGRCEIDLERIVKRVDKRLKRLKKPIKVAVMGCVVNGPGEAREADYGIAGGRGVGVIFKKGRIVKKVSEERLVKELFREIERDK